MEEDQCIRNESILTESYNGDYNILKNIFLYATGVYAVYLGLMSAVWGTTIFSKKKVSFQKSKELSVIKNVEEKDEYIIKKPTIAEPYKREYILKNIIFFTYSYIGGIYGLYLCFTSATWGTIIFTLITYFLTSLGLTAGAHRYFAHKSFKATKPLQIFLMLCHSVAYQRTLVTWVRDHRLHHKYSDTDADPHNISRGFFFSHIGWLFVKNHPEMVKRRELVDMNDIYANEVVMFQKRNAQWILPLFGIVIPTAIPWLLGDTFSNSWHLNILRYMLTSNITFLTNSLLHSWGYRPYDKTMSACQNLPLIVLTMGEGFHNYHHAFPWDYRTGEFGNNSLNYITRVIDGMEKLGLAYDLKTASDSVVENRKRRTGDGSDLWGKEIKEHEEVRKL